MIWLEKSKYSYCSICGWSAGEAANIQLSHYINPVVSLCYEHRIELIKALEEYNDSMS